jgi:hypothetical protein
MRGLARISAKRHEDRGPDGRAEYGNLLLMLSFDGLYCFGRSVCRLRVLSSDDGSPRVVLATHLDDAPGASIVNDFEVLVASVVSEFGEQPTRWLLHFPAPERPPDPDDPSWTEASVGPDSDPEWRHISRVEAASITGLDLSTADTEPATIAALAGDRELLRELAQVPEPERLPGEHLQALPVAALPFPHGPFRCPHNQRFLELARTYDDLERTVVGAHWYLTLSPEDFARCPFHQCDWRKVADRSVAILDSLAPDATHDDLVAACSEQDLQEQELEGLLSLFTFPIDWTPGSPSVTNGQHRLCALRAAGAEKCVVDTNGQRLHGTPAGSVEAAACAALASYWVDRTASTSTKR